MLRKLQSLLRRAALRRGYEIRKAHPESYAGVEVLNILELALRELVARKGGKVTFVEIGANDGVDFDPLRPFIEKYQLKGVLVEPQPSVFARLKANYAGVPHVTFENCAIGKTEGSLKLYYAKVGEADQNFATTLASSDRGMIEGYAAEQGGTVVSIDVPCITPDTLLSRNGLHQVDIIQLDTEGMDFEILQAFDLAKASPSIIHYESGQLCPAEQEKSYRYLTERGYAVLTLRGDTLAIPLHPTA